MSDGALRRGTVDDLFVGTMMSEQRLRAIIARVRAQFPDAVAFPDKLPITELAAACERLLDAYAIDPREVLHAKELIGSAISQAFGEALPSEIEDAYSILAHEVSK